MRGFYHPGSLTPTLSQREREFMVHNELGLASLRALLSYNSIAKSSKNIDSLRR